MKGLRAKKSEKMKKIHGEFSVAEEEINPLTLRSESASDKDAQVLFTYYNCSVSGFSF